MSFRVCAVVSAHPCVRWRATPNIDFACIVPLGEDFHIMPILRSAANIVLWDRAEKLFKLY